MLEGKNDAVSVTATVANTIPRQEAEAFVISLVRWQFYPNSKWEKAEAYYHNSTARQPRTVSKQARDAEGIMGAY